VIDGHLKVRWLPAGGGGGGQVKRPYSHMSLLQFADLELYLIVCTVFMYFNIFLLGSGFTYDSRSICAAAYLFARCVPSCIKVI
jgi:hypothetical protein